MIRVKCLGLLILPRLRKSGEISYTRLRELLLEKIEQLGMDPKAFGMHSLRAGGATAAAMAGVADRFSNVMAAGGQNQLRMVM